MSLLDDNSIAHDPEHGIGNERHSGVLNSGLDGRVEALADPLVSGTGMEPVWLRPRQKGLTLYYKNCDPYQHGLLMWKTVLTRASPGHLLPSNTHVLRVPILVT